MSTRDANTCGYRVILGENQKECSRGVDDPNEACVFHKDTSEKSSEETMEALLEELSNGHDHRPLSSIEEAPQFSGAKFEEITFQKTQLVPDCPFPLDLRNAEIGRLDIRDSTVLIPIEASDVSVSRKFSGKNTVFESTLDLAEAEIDGDLDFSDAVFHRKVTLSAAIVKGDLDFTNATFRAGVDCSGVDVTGDLQLDDAEIEGPATFEDSTVVGDISGTDATFHGTTDLTVEAWGALSSLSSPIDFAGTDFFGAVQIGGEFENNLNFERTTFDDRVEFDGAEVSGDIGLLEATLEDLRYSGGEVNGALRLHSTTVRDIVFENLDIGKLDYRRATVNGDFSVADVDVQGNFDFQKSTVRRQVDIEELKVKGRIYHHRSQFSASFSWDSITCGSSIKVADVQFHDNLSVESLSTEGSFGLVNSRFDGDVVLKTVFADRVKLTDSVFRGNCTATDFIVQGGPFNFRDSVFEGECTLTEIRTVDRILGDRGRFLANLALRDSRANVGVSMRGSVFTEEIQLEDIETPEAKAIDIDFAQARIDSGRITNSSGPLYDIDFTASSLGDVYFESDDDSIFDHLIFHNTDFVGFDFSRYRATLSEEAWTLHNQAIESEIPPANRPESRSKWHDKLVWSIFRPIVPTLKTWQAGREIASREPDSAPDDALTEEDEEQSGDKSKSGVVEENPEIGDETTFSGPATKSDVESLETTYLKAKSGADQVGAKNISSEYFLREMHYRQLLHAIDLHRGQLRGLGRWVGNTTMRLTAGYGERPLRVVFSALAAILLFALVYLRSGSEVVDGAADALSVSGGAFVTLIFDQTPQLALSNLQLIAMIEGFFGAMFVALLVFTLTRSIHR